MRILGIDPGTHRIGYGVIETGPKPVLLACGTLEPKGQAGEQLAALRTAISALIKKWRPDRAALERIFFGKNRKTALRVAEARGVILEAFASHQLHTDEFAPAEVKRLVAGDGGAAKSGVARMVRLTLDIPRLPKSDDAVDAIAIALSAGFRARRAHLTETHDHV